MYVECLSGVVWCFSLVEGGGGCRLSSLLFFAVFMRPDLCLQRVA